MPDSDPTDPTVALPILYSFRRCPYAIRARLALLSAGLAVELREVDLRHKPEALRACSPAATVPVLDLGGGQVLTQSLDIMRWALARHDPDGWLQTADQPGQQALVAANDGAFKQALDRYKYAERHPERSREAHREEAAACGIATLEARLQASAFLAGVQPGLSDAAVFPFVRQFAAVEPLWWDTASWPGTRRWLDHWLSRPLFAACMVPVKIWQPGAAPVRFPG
jgi:glutathione S-transferase